MTLGELITSARRKAFDTDRHVPLWTNADWIEYANEAERQACRRARLLQGPATLTLTSGTSLYSLPAGTLYVRRVKLASQQSPLRKIRLIELDHCYAGWEDDTEGTVERFCLDYERKKILFVRAPSATDTAKLTTIQLPSAAMEDLDDEPDIAEQYHLGLVNGMLAQAYLKDDQDTFDPNRAGNYEAKFAGEFGPPVTAADEAWINDRLGYDEDEGLF